MRFIVLFFLVLSTYAHSDSNIISENGIGELAVSSNGLMAKWVAEGSISTGSSLYTIGEAYDGRSSPNCSGYNHHCRITVYSKEIYFSGGAIQFDDLLQDNYLGNTGGGVCYFNTLSAPWGPSNRFSSLSFSHLLQNKNGTGATMWVLYSSWTKIDKSCNELTVTSPEVANMILPVAGYSGYVLMAPCPKYEAGMGPCNRAENVYGLSIGNEQKDAAQLLGVFRPNATIIACSSPAYSLSCTRSAYMRGDATSTPNIPTTSCDAIVPLNLNIEEVTSKEYIGKQVEDQIVVICNSDANLKINLSNDGLVTVGPFNVSVTVDGGKSTSVSLSNGSKNIPIKAIISSSNSSMEIEPGAYTGNIIVVTSIQ